MRDPDEFAIAGTATTTPQTLEFNFPATEINFVNDGANSIFCSFIDNQVANGFEVKSGEVRSWHNTASHNGRQRLHVKTSTSTSAFHGEALR